MRIKKSLLATALGFSLLAGLAQAPTAGAVVEWALTEDAVSLGLTGVSPHVERTGNADRVFRSDMVPSGTAVSLCSDAGSCTSETLNTGGGPVSDFAVAQTATGLRAYFKKIDMASNTQAVYSAACSDANCLSFGAATLASTGMQVAKDTKAWGVPDPVRLLDGRIRIYIVESPTLSSSCPEKVASYISSDGISFAKESGWRLEGGYVDTEVLRAKDGDWVMVMADGPGCGDRVQKLYMSTSNDGLTWAKPQKISGSDLSRLDPTGYEVSANVFRIYYATSSSPNSNNYTIKRGTIAIKQSSSDVAVTGGKKKATKATISCVKGKTTKKVTGVNPKCPSGYKKN